MKYVFGVTKRTGSPMENLKTVGAEHTNYTGYTETVRECPDGTTIRDRFRIVEKYASKEVNGTCYDWYTITEHSRDTDMTEKTKKALEQLTANIDYLSMMAGIDIPSREEGIQDDA